MDYDFSNPIFTPSVPRTWSPLLTIKQASQILNVSPWTLRKWDKEGKLIALRIGNRKDRRYKKETVLKVSNEGLI